jgi:hypothetical protein
MGSICQQDGNQLSCRLLDENGPTETTAHQKWQATAMIQVSVAEHYGIYAGRFEWEGVMVSFFVFAPTLDQATVQQNRLISNAENMAGTRYFACCSKKLDFHKCSLANPVSN